jgi:outer membrane lipoprotein-sorting protein
MSALKLKLLFLMLISAILIMLVPGCTMVNEFEPFEQDADITKDELFKRMMATSDPTGTYAKAKSYIQRQEQEFSTSSSKKSYFIVEVKFKRPDKFKVTTLKEWKPVSALIFNVDRAWQVDYTNENYKELEGLDLQRAKLFFSMGQPGNQYSAIFPEIKLTEWINGAEQYYKLACNAKIKGINPITIYVGKNNFLTKRLVINPKKEDGKGSYVSTMEKYGLYEGVMVASLSVVKSEGVEMKYRMIDYQLNIDILDSEFQPPVWE